MTEDEMHAALEGLGLKFEAGASELMKLRVAFAVLHVENERLRNERDEARLKLTRIESLSSAVLAHVPWTRVYDGLGWNDHPAVALRQELRGSASRDHQA